MSKISYGTREEVERVDVYKRQAYEDAPVVLIRQGQDIMAPLFYDSFLDLQGKLSLIHI